MEVFGSSKSGVVFGTAFVGAGRDEKRAPLTERLRGRLVATPTENYFD